MGISIWQLLIILLIVVVLFGTKKLRNIGGDLGGAIKNFRQSMRDGENETAEANPQQLTKDGIVTEGQVTNKQQDSKV